MEAVQPLCFHRMKKALSETERTRGVENGGKTWGPLTFQAFLVSIEGKELDPIKMSSLQVDGFYVDGGCSVSHRVPCERRLCFNAQKRSAICASSQYAYAPGGNDNIPSKHGVGCRFAYLSYPLNPVLPGLCSY